MNGFVSRSDLYPSLRILLSDQKFSFQAMMTGKELESEAQRYESIKKTILYLLRMTEFVNYDEGVTPGDEQQISDIISDLQDAGLEGDINQQFVQAQEEKLIDTLDTAMLEQSAMKNDVTSLREALQKEIKNQRQALARFATKGTLTKTQMSDEYTQ